MPPSITARCSVCYESLGEDGECLACLLRGGLSDNDEYLDSSPGFGDFEIERGEDGLPSELGSGAMGTTYRARDKVLHRVVALKVIDISRASGAEAVRARFLREARAAAALQHPNVARIFQFGASPEGRRCYYAMELVEGETLEALVRREGPLTPEQALDLAVEVARALVAAAAQGLIHRDLKPGNIMIAQSTGTPTPEVKVIDFGLAKAMNAVAEADLTHGSFIGTPAFASPEQFSGTPADARSDIYSLGATLWYALTGEVPYPGKTIAVIRERQQSAALPLAELNARKIPHALIEILQRTLALDPAGRPASARELLGKLEDCRAHKTSPVAWAKRKATWFALAAVLVAGAFVVWHLVTPRVEPALGKSIAVLPFANLSAGKENAFFADGVQDEILSDLAKVADLKVISRTSVLPYKSGAPRNLREIARTLGVSHVVEGSVQRAGSRVRVTAQLIDARSDAHLWAETYDRDFADVFSIQDEIAQRIADQLRAKISPAEKAAMIEPPTADLTAYSLYVQAKALASWTDWGGGKESWTKGVELLQEAIRRDPKFVLAYCLLARRYAGSYGRAQSTGEDSSSVEQVWKQTIDRALRLRPDLGEPHVAAARYYLFTNDFEGAARELAIARPLLPNDAEGFFIAGRVDRRLNRWEDSLAEVRKAYELDPHNGEIVFWTCEHYRIMRRYAEGEQFARQAMAAMPEVTSSLHVELAAFKLLEGDPRAAQEILARVPPEIGAEIRYKAALYLRDFGLAARVIAAAPAGEAEAAFGGKPPRSCADGELARARGDTQAAEAAFLAAREDWEDASAHRRRDEFYFSAIAQLDAGLGRKDEAIREAQRAVELVPISRDSLFGPSMVLHLARVYAWTGERSLAIEKLQTVAKLPGDLSYGELRFGPAWDPLRGDPRFERLVASLAPGKSERR
jgi:serine/threonine protein kinase/tetratricopeptide (TPR) repeat protein